MTPRFRCLFGPHDGRLVDIDVPTLRLPRLAPEFGLSDTVLPSYSGDDEYVRAHDADRPHVQVYVYKPVYDARLRNGP